MIREYKAEQCTSTTERLEKPKTKKEIVAEKKAAKKKAEAEAKKDK